MSIGTSNHKRALVTVAAGFIGSHLAERLLDACTEVLSIDSFTSYYDIKLIVGLVPVAERTTGSG